MTRIEIYSVMIIALLTIGGGLYEEHRAAQSGIDNMRSTISAIEGERKNEQQALQATLTAIAQVKRETVTPAQVIRELPQVITLPVPITSGSPVPPSPQGEGAAKLPDDNSKLPLAIIPQEDLKPLFDRLADCKACDAQVAEDHATIQQVTAERDAAVRAAKDGSWWHRVKHDAKIVGITLAIGVAVGYVAHR